MATKANGGVLNGWAVLWLMADNPQMGRTLKVLAKASKVLSEDQIEGALLAFVQLGVVRREVLDTGTEYYLLGTGHLELAAAELEGAKHRTADLGALYRKWEDGLPMIETLITTKRG